MQANGGCLTRGTLPPLLNVFSFVTNVFVVHSLVSLYARSTMVESCRQLFDEMPVKNSVSWNVMIGAYCQNGLYEEGIGLFRRMLEPGYKVDKVTLVSILPACAHLGAIGLGKWIHRRGKEDGSICVFLGTALIDMYGKCGFVHKAEVFEEMRDRNIVT